MCEDQERITYGEFLLPFGLSCWLFKNIEYQNIQKYLYNSAWYFVWM